MVIPKKKLFLSKSMQREADNRRAVKKRLQIANFNGSFNFDKLERKPAHKNRNQTTMQNMITYSVKPRESLNNSFVFEGLFGLGSSVPGSFEHTRKLEMGQLGIKDKPEQEDENVEKPTAVVENYIINPELITREMKVRMKESRQSISQRRVQYQPRARNVTDN